MANGEWKQKVMRNAGFREKSKCEKSIDASENRDASTGHIQPDQAQRADGDPPPGKGRIADAGRFCLDGGEGTVDRVLLFGTRSIERLDENLGALSVERTEDAFDAIDGLSSGFHVDGALYPDDIMKRSGP
jgi:hypothetical protein